VLKNQKKLAIKQKNKKEIDVGEMVESEKGEDITGRGGTAVSVGSGTEVMSMKHTNLPHCVDCGKKILWTHAALQCDP